jgi:hypothetical protein
MSFRKQSVLARWRSGFNPKPSWVRFILSMLAFFYFSLSFLRALRAEQPGLPELAYFGAAVVFGHNWIREWRRLG